MKATDSRPKLQVGLFPYLGFVLAFVILAVILGMSIWGIQKAARNFDTVIHAEEVSDHLIRLFAELKGMEDRQREFLLTKKKRFLKAYEAERLKIQSRVETIRQIAEIHPPLQVTLPQLEELVAARLLSLDTVLTVRQKHGEQAAFDLILTGHGRSVMKQIRDLVFAMDEEDATLIKATHDQAHRMVTVTLYAMAIGLGLIVLIAVIVVWKLYRDVLKQREMELQLIEEKKLADIARLLAGIGHDIKNLLTPILMGNQLLEEELREYFSGLPESERVKVRGVENVSQEVIAMTRNGTRRLQERVKEMGDAVKGHITKGNFGPCRPEKVIQETMDSLNLLAKEKSIQLKTEGLSALPVLHADEQQLFNAFYNLLNNAIPEVPPGGSITVKGQIAEEGNAIVISVADTGKGMSPDLQQMVLQGNALSRKPGGTGLGMKIVRDIVHNHHGTLTLESREGKGSVFHVRLPVSSTEIVSGS